MQGVANNPRAGWLEYFGLPDNLDEFTLDDLRTKVSEYVSAPAAGKAEDGAAPPPEQHRLIGIADFRDYLQRVGEPYRFMAANRPQLHSAATDATNGGGGSSEEGAADLSSVPALVFAADFDLTKPETFGHFSPPAAPAASMVVLERLTQNLDTVELRLLSEVAQRSEGFFHALETYEVLTREVARGVEQIEGLRAKMRSLESNLVHKSLALPRLVRRRANAGCVGPVPSTLYPLWPNPNPNPPGRCMRSSAFSTPCGRRSRPSSSCSRRETSRRR